jgi:hypothetical protein
MHCKVKVFPSALEIIKCCKNSLFSLRIILTILWQCTADVPSRRYSTTAEVMETQKKEQSNGR